LDKLQHIDDLLKKSAASETSHLVGDADWLVVEKKLKQRRNRIYGMWFLLALIVGFGSLGVWMSNTTVVEPSESIVQNPIQAIEKIQEEDLQPDYSNQDEETVVSENITAIDDGNQQEIASNNEYLATADKATAEISTKVTKPDAAEKATELENPVPPSLAIDFASKYGINTNLITSRNVAFPMADINTSFAAIKLNLDLIQVDKIKHNINTPHWETGLVFTPGLSDKIVSAVAGRENWINKDYDEIANSMEGSGFSNTFGINTAYHFKNKLFVGSGLYITQRQESVNYDYVVTEAPNVTNNVIFGYLPISPIQISYSGSNSYHFIEIPVNIGYKINVIRNFELRPQVGLSYLALVKQQGLKTNYVDLLLEDVTSMNLNTSNISANIKFGSYLNMDNWVIGVEPQAGVNLNSFRGGNDAFNVKPYNYGLTLSTAYKFSK
jgi:hypothetical protein